MNSKGIVALEDTSVCMKCLKKHATQTYGIGYRGYGSIFDNFNSHFQLCDDCARDEYRLWADESGECDEDEEGFYGEQYQYEENIEELIESFPLEGQELFYNRFAGGAGSHYNMTPQDWIDFKLDELPHEKCNEYGFYSPEEKKAYKERFPNCKCVVIEKYSDGSQGSHCPYGSFGGENGEADNLSGECYMCDCYELRKGDIEIINEIEEYYENEKARLLHMLEYANKRLKELDENVEQYMDKYDE